MTDDEFPLKIMRSVLSQRYDERQGGLTRIGKARQICPDTSSGLEGVYSAQDVAGSID